jgi:hypothetical protein
MECVFGIVAGCTYMVLRRLAATFWMRVGHNEHVVRLLHIVLYTDYLSHSVSGTNSRSKR